MKEKIMITEMSQRVGCLREPETPSMRKSVGVTCPSNRLEAINRGAIQNHATNIPAIAPNATQIDDNPTAYARPLTPKRVQADEALDE